MLRWAHAMLAIAAMLIGGVTPVLAQQFPSRPIKIVVPYAPSGSPDVMARFIANHMSAHIGQQVIVENKAGGNGIPASRSVARGDPDGYSILAVDGIFYGIVPAMRDDVPYDAEKDFAPLVQSVRTPMFLVVNAQLPVKTLPELLAYLRAHPETNYASAGTGGIHHILMEQFLAAAGIKLTHVPYRGVVEAVRALLAGDAKLMFNSLPSIEAFVEDGNLRLIAVGDEQRSPLRPNVPTVIEGGLSYKPLDFTMGYAVHAATPAPIRAFLEKAMLDALKSPDVAARLPVLGLELLAKPAADYAAAIPLEREAYAKVIQGGSLKRASAQ